MGTWFKSRGWAARGARIVESRFQCRWVVCERGGNCGIPVRIPGGGLPQGSQLWDRKSNPGGWRSGEVGFVESRFESKWMACQRGTGTERNLRGLSWCREGWRRHGQQGSRWEELAALGEDVGAGGLSILRRSVACSDIGEMALPPPKIGRIESLRCPPKWNEYIPKKNRHSESVREHYCVVQIQPSVHRRLLRRSSPRLPCAYREIKIKKKKHKSVQHPVFPSGRPPQY